VTGLVLVPLNAWWTVAELRYALADALLGLTVADAEGAALGHVVDRICCRFHTCRPVYRGFARIAATVRSVHPAPLRCEFRFGSAADGRGIPASFRARVIRAVLYPASRWANIHATTGAVAGSGSSLCVRQPHAACALFECAPASPSRYPYGGRPPRYRLCSRVCAAIAVRTRILAR
jgi:hypothetical protein